MAIIILTVNKAVPLLNNSTSNSTVILDKIIVLVDNIQSCEIKTDSNTIFFLPVANQKFEFKPSPAKNGLLKIDPLGKKEITLKLNSPNEINLLQDATLHYE